MGAGALLLLFGAAELLKPRKKAINVDAKNNTSLKSEVIQDSKGGSLLESKQKTFNPNGKPAVTNTSGQGGTSAGNSKNNPDKPGTDNGKGGWSFGDAKKAGDAVSGAAKKSGLFDGTNDGTHEGDDPTDPLGGQDPGYGDGQQQGDWNTPDDPSNPPDESGGDDGSGDGFPDDSGGILS